MVHAYGITTLTGEDLYLVGSGSTEGAYGSTTCNPAVNGAINANGLSGPNPCPGGGHNPLVIVLDPVACFWQDNARVFLFKVLF